ncbi:MAG: hypothetical protein WCR27_04095 [Eubacteriales bacterium]
MSSETRIYHLIIRGINQQSSYIYLGLKGWFGCKSGECSGNIGISDLQDRGEKDGNLYLPSSGDKTAI